MTAYRPHLAAPRVNRLLKESLAELQRVEKCAVLWFAEILNRKLYRDLGYSSVHQYAAVELKFGKARTAQFIRLAESLHDLPRLRRSLARGEVSWTKAREVARVATPVTEKAWIDHARGSTSRELERKVSETKKAAWALRTGAAKQRWLAETGGEAPSPVTAIAQTSDPAVSAVPDPTLAAHLRPEHVAAEVPVGLNLRFTPAQYARYEAMMEKLRKMGRHGSREEILLAAMETAVQEGTLVESRSGEEPGSKRESRSGRRSASEDAPREHMPTSQIEHRPFPRGNSASPYQVVVLVCDRCEAGSVETARGSLTLSPEALKAILCDAKVRRRGKPNRAVIPAGIRRRVLERDRFRCRGEGCTRTRFLSVHHLVPREAGGGNQVDNLVTLCEGCHRAAHRARSRQPGAGSRRVIRMTQPG